MPKLLRTFIMSISLTIKADVPIGECIAALGYMRWAEVKEYLGLWKHLEEVVV